MAKGDLCRISNCTNTIKIKGTVCAKHHWRKKKFNSYDLPGHTGIPSYYQKKELPKDIVTICKIHGDLKREETYVRFYKGKESSFYCKKCVLSINIKNKYKGLNSLDCYEKLLKKQNGLCAICFKKNTTTRNGKIKRYAIDHDHKSQKVRGLLCGFCNSLIGYARDSIETLQSAIKYLTESKLDEE